MSPLHRRANKPPHLEPTAQVPLNGAPLIQRHYLTLTAEIHVCHWISPLKHRTQSPP